jgi:PAS domain S-box-containing protein
MAGDITECPEIEAALREGEERYLRLMELFPDLVLVHSEGKIVLINTAGARLLGASSSEQLVGKPIMDFVHPDDREMVVGRIGQMEDEETQAGLVEQKWLRLDGTVIEVEVAAIALTYQDKPAIEVVARDLTERKLTQAALRESEERHRRLMELYLDSIGVETARSSELRAALRRAQEMDQLKTQLLSTVSHELRTPLTSIRGQTTTLLDYADQITPEERQEALRIVDEEAARLDELIGHVLDMSRLEAGKLSVELGATDVRPIVQEAVAQMAARTPSHKLVVNLPPTLPLAQADPRRVTQVVNNLLDNATKFSPPGATVTVDIEEHTHTVIVRVRDEGPGIAPEHLQHIFNRFYRVEQQGVRTSGVGLGLAICKGLVEAMGGQIAVTSQVGQGSVFSFSLLRTPAMSSDG